MLKIIANNLTQDSKTSNKLLKIIANNLTQDSKHNDNEQSNLIFNLE
ncbi:hypothetical protein NO976_01964 [Planktothrix agardhii]|jgi:predicted solute-binding protein|uniref:Uncharacterized protein n=1 Tax=Planktothrix agardhii TaxID=1160 RepID=A0AAD1Q4E7_PLAAG|nr:hypothetical protein NO976_01964 [Planktothrix agardhii]CAD5951788.1 hypothetical protein PANO66_02667 [Planktothrix agardhii]CAD5959878.1 hypothetical protein NO365_03117 [Planktothrix agardhii]